MGSQGDTEFLISSDWNAANHVDGCGGVTGGPVGDGTRSKASSNGPDGDLDSSVDSSKSPMSSSTPTAAIVSGVTFADVTPNKQRLPPPSELTPPASLPSTPQKKFTSSSQGTRTEQLYDSKTIYYM